MIKEGHGKIINILSLVNDSAVNSKRMLMLLLKGGLKGLTRNICSGITANTTSVQRYLKRVTLLPQTDLFASVRTVCVTYDQFVISRQTPREAVGEMKTLWAQALFLASDASKTS